MASNLRAMASNQEEEKEEEEEEEEQEEELVRCRSWPRRLSGLLRRLLQRQWQVACWWGSRSQTPLGTQR